MKFKIIGSGIYIPRTEVTSEELEQKHDIPAGLIQKKFGISSRYYANPNETSSYMGAEAIKQATRKANIKLDSIDLIINASATTEQPIPVTSILMQEHLGLDTHGTPCFDVNGTCISFLLGLNLGINLLANNQYSRIAIVSSEIASVGMNWDEFHSWPLFGDGAAAVVIEKGQCARMHGYLHQTFSQGKDLCRIAAGGTKLNLRSTPQPLLNEYCFAMEGHEVFKLAARKFPRFIFELLKRSQLSIDEIDLFVPHQASGPAITHMQEILKIDKQKVVETYQNFGNQIAASIPVAWDTAITEQRIKPGMRIMLIGSAAGLSMSGMVLEV